MMFRFDLEFYAGLIIGIVIGAALIVLLTH